MRRILLLIIFFTSTFCFSQQKLDNFFEGFVSYKIELPIYDEILKSFNPEKDTLVSQDMYVGLKANVNSIKSIIGNYNQYMCKDTIRVSALDSEIIFIPKLFKRHHFEYDDSLNLKSSYVTGKKYDSLKNSKLYTYNIQVNKEETTKILNRDCYKIILTENFNNKIVDLKTRFELFVDPTVPIPFIYYEFLNLKQPLSLKGLIVKVNFYTVNKNIPLFDEQKPSMVYVLSEYNVEKQDPLLKRIDVIKKPLNIKRLFLLSF